MSINAITGYSGVYDGITASNPIKYGMNAANNMEKFAKAEQARGVNSAYRVEYKGDPKGDGDIFAEALEKFAESLEQDTFTPAKYRYQYSTVDNGEVNKLSLLGAAYEEMGKKTSSPVRNVTKLLQKYYPTKTESKKSVFSTKPLDTNKNGKIETEEYATFLALSDIKSKDKTSEDISDMDGTITDEGVKEAMSYLAVNASNPVTKHKLTNFMRGIFKNIQENLGLQGIREEFDAEIKHIDLTA